SWISTTRLLGLLTSPTTMPANRLLTAALSLPVPPVTKEPVRVGGASMGVTVGSAGPPTDGSSVRTVIPALAVCVPWLGTLPAVGVDRTGLAKRIWRDEPKEYRPRLMGLVRKSRPSSRWGTAPAAWPNAGRRRSPMTR